MSTRRRKAIDPQVHAQQLAARKRVVEELRERGIEVRHDEQYRIIGASRVDVFGELHKRKSLSDTHLIAAKRLEVLIGVAYGHEQPDRGERVDGNANIGPPGQKIGDTMIDAMGIYRGLMKEVGFTNARLLRGLLEPVDVAQDWRKTVLDVTREARSEVQSAMIRTACENLALAWQAFDYRARERREKAA